MFINVARSSQYIASMMITAEDNNDQLIITMTNLGPDLAEALQLVWDQTI